MSDFVIKTEQLTKVYGEQTAVNSVDLHVKKAVFMGSLAVMEPGRPLL